jgi:hypothetical protein
LDHAVSGRVPFNHGSRKRVDIISRDEQIGLERQNGAAIRTCK